MSTDNTLTTSVVTLQDGSVNSGIQVNPPTNLPGNSILPPGVVNNGSISPAVSNAANPALMQSFVLSSDISNPQTNLPGSSGVFQGLVLNPSGTVTNAPSTSGLVLLQAPNTVATTQFTSEAVSNTDNTLGLAQNQPMLEPSTSQELDNSSRGRSKSRNDQSHQRRRRRHSSSSSSSGSSHSPRRKRKSHQLSNDLLSQLVGMLSSLPQFSQDTNQPSTSGFAGQAPPTESHVPSEASDYSDPDTPHQPPSRDFTPNPDLTLSGDQYDSDDDDDQPLYGTDIPKEAFEKAVEVLRRQLGYVSESTPELSSSKSRLTLNTPTSSLRPSLPVDAECADRFRALSHNYAGRKWTAYSKAQNLSFRVEDNDWKDLFKTPPVPQEADDYLRSVGATGLGGKLKSITARKSLRSLHQLDTASRVGMKFASSLLLIAEVLSKSFRHSSSAEVSRKDTASLVTLLGPLARRVFDQFARVSVKSVVDRRDIILDAMNLSQESVRRHFQNLPVLGDDIFAGQFDSVLQEEAKRKSDLQKAHLSSNRPFFRRSPPRYRTSRPPRGRRQPPTRSSSRSASQPVRLRQPRGAFQNQSRFRSRGSSRGSSSSRGRSFMRP